MEFLGVGPLELIFVIVIALIVIGPNDMAKAARSAGRFLNRMYRSEVWRGLTQASRTLRNLPNRLAREAALQELDAVRDTIKAGEAELKDTLRPLEEDLRAWTPEGAARPPAPLSGPPPTPSTIQRPHPGGTEEEPGPAVDANPGEE